MLYELRHFYECILYNELISKNVFYFNFDLLNIKQLLNNFEIIIININNKCIFIRRPAWKSDVTCLY